jgi:hypothetical protein
MNVNAVLSARRHPIFKQIRASSSTAREEVCSKKYFVRINALQNNLGNRWTVNMSSISFGCRACTHYTSRDISNTSSV